MDSNLLLVLYALIFIGALLAVEGLFQLVTELRGGTDEHTVNRRLRMLASGIDPEEVLRLLRRPTRPERLARLPVVGHLPILLTQAGIKLAPELVLGGMVALSLSMFMLLQSRFAPISAVGVSLAVGIVLPVLLLIRRRQRRRDEIAAQLPEAIDLIVRSVRAGHPLNTALGVVARETPDPLGSEVGVVVDEITYGVELTEAVAELSRRVGLEDLHYLAMAIRIQHGTGGNLAEILSSLARMIRERFAMRRKIKAVSAEGRASALALSFMPPGIAGLVTAVAPSYYGDVAGDPMFMPAVYLALGLSVLNAYVLRRMTRFHI